MRTIHIFHGWNMDGGFWFYGIWWKPGIFSTFLGLFWGSKVQEILVLTGLKWRMLGYGFVQPVNIAPMLW